MGSLMGSQPYPHGQVSDLDEFECTENRTLSTTSTISTITATTPPSTPPGTPEPPRSRMCGAIQLGVASSAQVTTPTSRRAADQLLSLSASGVSKALRELAAADELQCTMQDRPFSTISNMSSGNGSCCAGLSMLGELAAPLVAEPAHAISVLCGSSMPADALAVPLGEAFQNDAVPLATEHSPGGTRFKPHQDMSFAAHSTGHHGACYDGNHCGFNGTVLITLPLTNWGAS